ncbi:hypothetical protein NHX12_006046 [Muraenolepis orangiensis]|uniref:Uncharacterized protein n=1 Tax=Muraenolepis orangiensis TaxID=630683 RepID=A0A9Q0IAW3_9TELE|nr:hypothetical protein NHX12_006046 [Muraenolepis orangiensis]
MASVWFTWVFLQAVLLLDIHCSPVKNAPTYKGGSTAGGSTAGGSSKAPGLSPAKEVDHGYSSTGPGDKAGIAVGIPSPAGYSNRSPAKDISWAISPDLFSWGDDSTDYRRQSSSSADVSPAYASANPAYAPAPMSGQEFIPGELQRIESTMEDGGYESETQEMGLPPLPPYTAAGVNTGPQAVMPRGSFGYFYPYDWMLLTGQYPPGTYTHSSSSQERGRDDWQENHYLRYEYPSSPVQEEEEQQQYFPSAADQSSQMPGDQEEAGWDTGKGTSY